MPKAITIPFALIMPLVGLVLIPSLLHAMPSKKPREDDVLLGIWQLKTRRQAQAIPAGTTIATRTAPQPGINMAYYLDKQEEIQVDVQKCDGGPDGVTLSNAVSLDDLKHKENLRIRFSVRAERSHAVVLVLRESNRVHWSSRQLALQEWQDISLPISFRTCRSHSALLSLQFGETEGKITVANLRIEPE